VSRVLYTSLLAANGTHTSSSSLLDIFEYKLFIVGRRTYLLGARSLIIVTLTEKPNQKFVKVSQKGESPDLTSNYLTCSISHLVL
jgi:hypothetical protein